MSNVVDFATRQPLPEQAFLMSPGELCDYARAHPGPDFVKRRGVMVITPERQDEMDRMFEVFSLGIRSDGDPERQINAWAWLGSRVATALSRYARGDFEMLERTRREPDFVCYVEALALGNKPDAAEAAKRLGVFDGMDDDHRFSKAMDL